MKSIESGTVANAFLSVNVEFNKKYKIIDNVYAWLNYKNNMLGNIWFSKNSLGQRNGLKLRIFGTNLSVEWDHSKPEKINLYYKNGKIEVEKAYKIKKVCKSHNIKIDHSLNLLKAFKQDVTKKRYKTWSELINYCRFSAVPVGRFVIDLHKENKKSYKYSDPLCIALQILNHIQDCKEDYENLDRVYLPMNFLKKYNVKLSQLKKNL